MTRYLRQAVAAAIGAAAFAAPVGAQAATLEVSGSTMTYRAAPGETNRVGGPGTSDLRLVGGEYRFREDSGTRVAVGAGCRRASERVYACAASGVRRILVDLGDGIDELRMSAGLPVGTRIEGGAGTDGLDYSGMRRLRITLDGRPNDGGGRDNVAANVEEFYGGDNEDRLSGDGSAEFFRGQVGDDVLRGAAGDDTLIAYEPDADPASDQDGNDLVYGEQGDDRIFAAGFANLGASTGDLVRGGSDRISCGPGTDFAVMDDSDAGGGRECEVLGTLSNEGQVFRGSAGDDRIAVLDTAGRPSRALGLGGDDVLIDSEFQDDKLLGGNGDDFLEARDDSPPGEGDYVDTVDCGPGTDTASVDGRDRVTGCETVRRPS